MLLWQALLCTRHRRVRCYLLDYYFCRHDLSFWKNTDTVVGYNVDALGCKLKQCIVYISRKTHCTSAGLMVAAERRQEFRVRLQKRARRRAEKRTEYLDDEKNWKEVDFTQVHVCRQNLHLIELTLFYNILFAIQQLSRSSRRIRVSLL